MLRRLAAFVGHFTLDAALEVVTSATLDRSTVFSAMDSLVAKSILATRPIGAMMRYRLLDTMRAYVLDIKIDDAEFCRSGRTPCRLLSPMAGAVRNRMVKLDERRGTESSLCRHRQRSGRFGMVLLPQRKCQHRRGTCRRRRPGVLGDVFASGMSALVGASTARTRRHHSRRVRGDASSGGLWNFLNVYDGERRTVL